MTNTCVSFRVLFSWQLVTQMGEDESLVYLHNHRAVLQAFLAAQDHWKLDFQEPEIPGRTPHVFSAVTIRVTKLSLKLAIIVR